MSTSDSATCPRCGRPVRESDDRFCGACGAELHPDQTSAGNGKAGPPSLDASDATSPETPSAEEQIRDNVQTAFHNDTSSRATAESDIQPIREDGSAAEPPDAERTDRQENATDESGSDRGAARKHSKGKAPQAGSADRQSESVSAEDVAKSYAYKRDAQTTRPPKPDVDLERLSIHPLNTDDVEKVEAVFVEPPDYAAQQHGVTSHVDRVHLVYGPRRSGKLTCAVKLGLDLCAAQQAGEPKFSIYDRRFHDPRTLLAFVLDKSLTRGADIRWRRLRENLVDSFSLAELRILCFDLAPELFRELPNNQHTTDIAIDLIYYMERTGRTADLIIECERQRPDLTWRDASRSSDSRAGATEALTQPQVYIIEQAFENGVERSELAADALNALNSELRAKQSYLILTTEYDYEKPSDLHVPQMSAKIPHEQMDKVIERHLDYYARDRKTVQVPEALALQTKKNLTRFTELFSLPWQVDQYCRKVADLPSDSPLDALIECAAKVVQAGQEPPRRWFSNLSENERLYAMLAVLFEGLDRLTLDELYVTAVHKLRSEGVTLADARDVGLTELLEKIHAHETEAQLVRFDGPSFEQEARRQIRNHHHLLWSLIDWLWDLIEAYRAPAYWELRRALGAAIGRLGIYHRPKLHGVLTRLATETDGGVAAVAGYALDRVCQEGPEHQPFVLEIVADWVKSGNPNWMWTAGAAIWRMYDGLARTARAGDNRGLVSVATETLGQLRADLTLLAKSFDVFNTEAREEALRKALTDMASEADSVDDLALSLLVPSEVQQRMVDQFNYWAERNLRGILHAVHWMAMGNARDVVGLLREWLTENGDGKLRAIGELAASQMFEESAVRDLQLMEERHRPLLDLIEPLLLADCDAVRVMMRALMTWAQQPDWAKIVHSELVRVANRAKPDAAQTLRNGLLEHWLESEEPDIQHIARSVLTRLAIMGGAPVEMPGYSHAAVVLDASLEAMRGRSLARVGQRLHAGLDPLIDTHLVRMGQITVRGAPEQPPSPALLQPSHQYPRLLYEPLAALSPARTSLSVALTTGPILDFADVCSEPWADRVMVATVGKQPGWLDAHQAAHPELVVLTKSFPSHVVLLEQQLNKQLVRRLAMRSADEWRKAIEGSLKPEATFAGDDDEALTKQVGRLDDIEHEDSARQILGTIFWYAGSNPARCVELLCKWMLSSDALCVQMGTACATGLFELYAARNEPPAVTEYACLLELAALLGNRGWHSVEIVLKTARKWVTEPGWDQRLFARPDGATSELVRMVHAVAPQDRSSIRRLLIDWLEPSADRTPPREPVMRLARLLLIQTSAGERVQLPDLPAGSTYGVVLIDAEYDNRDKIGLCELAAKLIAKIPERSQKNVHLLVYRLGELGLVAGPGERPKAADLAPSKGSGRARLIGPVLEQLPLPQVGMAVLLSSGPALDEEDWHNTAWSSRLLVYGWPIGDRRPSAFRLLPCRNTPEEAENMLLEEASQELGA
jgi:hypothetical protein